MKFETKSIIFGRKKRENPDDEDYPFFIAFFSVNNPHTSGKVPDSIREFPHIHKVVVTGLDFNYLLMGNDIVINDLEEIDVEVCDGHVHLTGIQKKE
jgi:hypothetical protein